MTTLSILALVLLSFSGAPLLYLLCAESIRGKSAFAVRLMVLYGSISAIAVIETSFVAAFRFEDIRLLMARNESLSSAAIDALMALKDAARIAILFSAAGFAAQASVSKSRAGNLLLPAAWSVPYLAFHYGGIQLLPSGMTALFLDGAYSFLLMYRGFAYLRKTPERDAVRKEAGLPVTIAIAVFIPLRLALNVIDAFIPSGLSPYLLVYPDLVFFFALNYRAYRFLFGRGFGAGHPGTPSGDDDPADKTAFYGTYGLSARESEIARLLVDHASYKEIADSLFISVDTVKSHAKAVYRKTGCANRLELIARSRHHPSFTPGKGALPASTGKNHPLG